MRRGCLLGLALSGKATRAVAALMARWPAAGGAWSVRMVALEELHLTVRFLGDVAEPGLRSLLDRLPEVAERHPLDAVAVSGLGAAPTIAQPRIVLASVPGPGAALTDLHARLDGLCQSLGCAPLSRPWRPHVSLARVDGAPVDGPISEFVQRHRQYHLGPADASRLILFAKQSPEGPLAPLAHWPLGRRAE